MKTVGIAIEEKIKSQLQQAIMAVKSIKEPFLLIPFDSTEVRKPQNCEDKIPFIFPGVEGKFIVNS